MLSSGTAVVHLGLLNCGVKPGGEVIVQNFTFFSAFLICCGLYGYAIYLHNGHIVEGQNRIIKTYSQQVERIESRRNSINIRDNLREKEMEAFHQEAKSLLELEFNRIQIEFRTRMS